MRGRRRDERGVVTAEAAAVLPLLVAVTMAMLWLLVVGIGQMQVTDAAREAARAVARGESTEHAERLALIAAPGSDVAVARDGDLVVVTVSRTLASPGGLFDVVPGARVAAEAAAVPEEGEARGP